MSALLLSSKPASLLSQNCARKTSHGSAPLRKVKPFTSARKNFTTLRATDTVEAGSANVFDQAYAELADADDETLEGEEVNVEEYEGLLAELPDQDILECLASEQLIAEDPQLKTVLENARATSVARAYLKTEMGEPLSPLEEELVGQVVSSLQVEEVVPEDIVPVKSFVAPDDEELRTLSPEQKEAVQSYKLSKSELKGLVPKNWSTLTVDWFANKKEDLVPLPTYRLTFLWLEKNISVAVDQVYARGTTSPMTEYFFWPRKDAWEELRAALESRPWVSERDKIILLNRLTEVINFWQEPGVKHTLDEARAQFPDCVFMGQS